MGELEEGILEDQDQQDGPQQVEAIAGARPGGLHQMGNADGRSGEEDARAQGLQSVAQVPGFLTAVSLLSAAPASTAGRTPP